MTGLFLEDVSPYFRRDPSTLLPGRYKGRERGKGYLFVGWVDRLDVWLTLIILAIFLITVL